MELKTAGFKHEALKSSLSGGLATKNQVFVSPGNFERFKEAAISQGSIPSDGNYANTYGVPLDLEDREKFSTFAFNATPHPSVPADRIEQVLHDVVWVPLGQNHKSEAVSAKREWFIP